MLRYKRIENRTHALVHFRWVNWSKYMKTALRKKKNYVNIAFITVNIGGSPIGAWNYVVVLPEPLDSAEMLEKLDEFEPKYADFFRKNMENLRVGVEIRKYKKQISHECLYRVYDEEGLRFKIEKITNPTSPDFSLQTVGIDWDYFDRIEARDAFRIVRKKFPHAKKEQSKKSYPGDKVQLEKPHWHVVIPKKYDFIQHMSVRGEYWDDTNRIMIDKLRYENSTVFNVLFNYKYY